MWIEGYSAFTIHLAVDYRRMVPVGSTQAFVARLVELPAYTNTKHGTVASDDQHTPLPTLLPGQLRDAAAALPSGATGKTLKRRHWALGSIHSFDGRVVYADGRGVWQESPQLSIADQSKL